MYGQLVDPDAHNNPRIGGVHDFKEAMGPQYGTDKARAEAEKLNKGHLCGK